MTLQTLSQLILLCGIILTALGGYGSYHFGKIEEKKKEEIASKEQNILKEQLAQLQSNTTDIQQMMELVYQESKALEEVWTEVEMKNVPPSVTDYLLLLFISDKGRIAGKVRVKGSEYISSFSTTANDKTPIALRNLWLPSENQYKVPTIMEFTISEKTEADSTLSIYTAGWIDTRGTEPH